LEAVISVEALKRDTMIATQGLKTVDSGIPLEIPREHKTKPGLRYVLKNTLGFGGANACFLLEKTP
jgi:3-oxoacyl-(acyl-carrier-protein) synthase